MLKNCLRHRKSMTCEIRCGRPSATCGENASCYFSQLSSLLTLSDFEPLEFDAGGPDLRKIILRLLNKPAFSGAAEYL